MPRFTPPSGTFEVHWQDAGTDLTFVTQSGDGKVTLIASVPRRDLSPSHPELLAALEAATGTNGAAVAPLAHAVIERLAGRAELALSYFVPGATGVARWLMASREVTNFTYDLKARNVRYLAHFLASALNVDVALARDVLAEPGQTPELHAHLAAFAEHPEIGPVCDAAARFGRRIAWYAIARITKPRLIVETGVDQGIGALILCEALRRNELEGKSGRYVGLDINPAAGLMLGGAWAKHGAIWCGDAIESIGRITDPVDLYICDSDHSADYEYREYRAMAPHLGPTAAVIADNAHVTDCLCRFSEETGRSFSAFREEPENHWYPGCTLGLSMPRR